MYYANGNVKKSNKKIIIIVLIVVLIIVGVICTVLLLNKKAKPKYLDANILAKDYLDTYLAQDADAMLDFYYPDYVDVEGKDLLKVNFEEEFTKYNDFVSDKQVTIEIADVKIEDARKYDVGGYSYEIEFDVDIQARASIQYHITVEYEEFGYVEKCDYVDMFYAYKIKNGWYMDSRGLSLKTEKDKSPVGVAEAFIELWNNYTDKTAKNCVHKSVYHSDVFEGIELTYDEMYTQASKEFGVTWDVNIALMEDATQDERYKVANQYKLDYNLDVSDVRRIIYNIGAEGQYIQGVYYAVKIDDIWYMALDVEPGVYE
ncbi:MAG: hypothetical protein MJ105_05650 [Lachnospiraceae bacterium]|nr:hypothetical protein [Lachnospiraceae bacterium]